MIIMIIIINNAVDPFSCYWDIYIHVGLGRELKSPILKLYEIFFRIILPIRKNEYA